MMFRAYVAGLSCAMYSSFTKSDNVHSELFISLSEGKPWIKLHKMQS